MAFKEQITQLSTSKTNHADNFNQIFNELHDNGKYLKKEIESNDSEISALQKGKVDGETYQLDKQTQAMKDSDQDSILNALKKDKLENTDFEEYKVQQAQKNTEQDKRMETIETDAQKETERINTKIDNKIGMNEVFDDTNFNFIENQVVQDGLVFSKIDEFFTGVNIYVNTGIDYSHNGIYDISFKLKIPNINQSSNRAIVGIWSYYQKFGWFVNVLQTGNSKVKIIRNKTDIEYAVATDYIPVVDEYVAYRVTIVNGTLSLYADNECIAKNIDLKDVVIGEDKKIYFGSTGQGMPIQNGYYKDILIYNKQLTSQEIMHNLSVLNNSSSIKELHATDTEGKTSILKFASDTDHVEDRAGRTQEQINRTFYKRMCKEIPSQNGEPITVNNGEEGYVLNAEIKGQTVKCVSKVERKITINNITPVTQVRDATITKGKEYTFIFNVVKNTRTSNSYFGATVTFGECDIPAGKTGLIKEKRTALIDENKIHIGVRASDEGTELVIEDYIILEGDYTTQNMGYMPFGLNSTEATMTTNGMKYRFYEPTIQGKTRILKATKGTQNWVEISADEVRDIATYDYKLDSINGDLGSIPNVTDIVGRANKVKAVNTKEMVLTGNEDWKWVGLSSDSTKLRVALSMPDMKLLSNGVCDKFKWATNISTAELDECLGSHSSSTQIHCVIKVSKLTSPNEVGFKALLKQLYDAGTPVTLRYQPTTPQEVKLTDEEFKAYDAYKKLISLDGIDDVRSTLEIKEDGGGVYNQHLIGEYLNGNDFSYSNSVIIEGVNTIGFYSSNLSLSKKTSIICDKLPTYASWGKLYSKDSIGIGGGEHQNIPRIVIRLNKNDLGITSEDTSTQKRDKMIEYLGKNKHFIIRPLASTLTTYLDKSIMPTILTQQTNIWEVGGAVKASSYKITQPVDAVGEIRAEINEIKKQLGAVAALQLVQIN